MLPTPSRSTRCSRSRPENCLPSGHSSAGLPRTDGAAPRTHRSNCRINSTSSYRPRIFDPCSGFIDKTTRIRRHCRTGRPDRVSSSGTTWSRMRPISEPVRPIVFYLDPAMPRSVHKLVEEAVSWWKPAFEAAGYKNVLQVKRAWHRSLRFDTNAIFWVPQRPEKDSVGEVVLDPRTGQILKSIVRIDAKRTC